MIKTLGPREAEALVAGTDVDIIDVREPKEWSTGHLPGARLVPLDQLRAEPEKSLPRDNVLFVCAKGARSLAAAKVAERYGLQEIYSLEGGTNAWIKAGLPAVHPDDAKSGRAAPPPAAPEQSPATSEPNEPALDALIAANLRELRASRDLSLDALAKLSGIARAQLGQIELGRTTPGLDVVWKLARALDVPFATLVTAPARHGTVVVRLRRSQARKLVSSEGRFGSRPLFPPSERGGVEFYELWLAGHSREESEAHPPGTRENLVVTAGKLVLEVGGESHRLDAGDAIIFAADVPHAYANPGNDECWMHLVMSYRPSPEKR
jgi:rhodanese-related sulfurtransferase/transcriptional regulator with XRE-family HTH domain